MQLAMCKVFTAYGSRKGCTNRGLRVAVGWLEGRTARILGSGVVLQLSVLKLLMECMRNMLRKKEGKDLPANCVLMKS